MAMKFSKEDEEKLKNDTSAIYQKRKERLDKEEFASLSRRQKWQQFQDYYLKRVVIVVLILCVAVVGIVQAVRKKACSLYIAVQSDVIPEEEIPYLEEALAEYLGFDRNREEVTIDITSTKHQLQAYFYAGTADILITDEKSFEEWGKAGYFYASNDGEEVAFYQEYPEEYRYYTRYVTGEDVLNNKTTKTTETEASDETEYNCGLYLTDSEKYRQMGGIVEKPVAGIATTTGNLEEAEAFLRFMMDNSQKLPEE